MGSNERGKKRSSMFPLDISILLQPCANRILCITYITRIGMTETKKVKKKIV